MRTCPFHNCNRTIPESMFACRGHWYSLSKPERDDIWAAWNAYLQNCISIEELRDRQQAVLGSRGTV